MRQYQSITCSKSKAHVWQFTRGLCLQDSRFNHGSLTERNVSKLCKEGQLDEALQYVDLSNGRGIHISRNTIYVLLLECSRKKDLVAGRRVRSLMVERGLDSIASLGDHLIRLFASSGSLLEASQAFSKVSKPSVYTWSAIISAHAELGKGIDAFELYYKMQQVGTEPDKVTFLCILKACSSMGAIGHARLIHHQIIERGLDTEMDIGSTCIDMYAKCGSLVDAQIVFDNLPSYDEVSWGAMIAAYSIHGCGLPALELFKNMQEDGLKPGKIVFICVLRACSSVQAIEHGRLIHHQIISSGVRSDVVLGSTLVDMYAKSGNLEEARKVFDKLPRRNVVSWGAMIAGYAQHGHGFPAFDLFEKMQQDSINPDKVIYLCILKACGRIRVIRNCRMLHNQLIRSGLNVDISIGNALIDTYSKCGSLHEGHKVFDGLVRQDRDSWGAVISGYVTDGRVDLAFELFDRMQLEGITPNRFIFLCLLKACSRIGANKKGMEIHDQIMRCALESDVPIKSSLIDMYAKCGCLDEAQKAFDELPDRDVVSWGAMIAGYAAHCRGLFALKLFEKMQQEGTKPDKVIFLCILKACGCVGALEQGRLVHSQIIKSKLESDVVVGNTIVDMYAKCGSIREAGKAFDLLTDKDVVSWATMIAGSARHGSCRLAEHLLENMQRQGLKPKDVIFTSILAAFSHLGLMEGGYNYFESMMDHGIAPNIEHFSCIVDCLSRVGCLIEAEDVLQTMPIAPDIVVWISLLTSCRTYGDVELGRRCFDRILQLDPDDASGYVLMSNVYADAQIWNGVSGIRELRKSAGIQKKPGIAQLKVNNQMHEFLAGGNSHLQSDAVDNKLERVSMFIKKEGYVPQLDLVLDPMADKDKEETLFVHYGLVHQPQGILKCMESGTPSCE